MSSSLCKKEWFSVRCRCWIENSRKKAKGNWKSCFWCGYPEIFRGGSDDPVVEFGEVGSFHRPGPNSTHYEDVWKGCGAHLVFNAFWLISNFCVHQMLMRDEMHAIDLGIIITLIRAILRAFMEIVGIVLDIQGRHASKLEMRFRNVVARRTERDRQRYV